MIQAGDDGEAGGADDLQRAASEKNLPPVISIGGFAGEQHQRQHGDELHQPDHADKKGRIGDRVVDARDRIDLPAKRHALRQHGDRRQEAREQQKTEVGVAQKRQILHLTHIGSSFRRQARAPPSGGAWRRRYRCGLGRQSAAAERLACISCRAPGSKAIRQFPATLPIDRLPNRYHRPKPRLICKRFGCGWSDDRLSNSNIPRTA